MKRFFALFMILLLFCVLGVEVSAAEASPNEAPVTTAETVITEEAPPEDITSEEKSAIEEISDAVKEYVPEILGGLTLAFSAIVLYMFKKGLLPKVAQALSMIDGTVSGYNKKAEELVKTLTTRLELSEDTSRRMLERVTLQEADVKSALAAASRILLAQSDSLFDLLEHTNLPASEKAAIAAKHREQLAEIHAMMGGGAGEE